MKNYDVIVIGGGLLGCFAARNLTRYRLRVALLEKREDVCTGISRANTAIIYSGCDTKPGTLKTSMCVRASQSFPQLCDELGVRYSPCGSIMVSFGKRGDDVLNKKLADGKSNGVRGIRLLGREEMLELEPYLSKDAHTGLYVPDTGTVMPWELCLAAVENAIKNGADVFLNTEVTGISPSPRQPANGFHDSFDARKANDQAATPGYKSANPESIFEIRTNKGTFISRSIVNCAGMDADSVHEMLAPPAARIDPSAGDYYVLDTKASGHVRQIIFHEPEVKGKGLTLVPTADGNILIGPTERPGDDYATAISGLNELREMASQVMPTLPMEHVIRSFGAVRPNPYAPPAQNMRGISRTSAGLETGGTRRYSHFGASISDFCITEDFGGALISMIGIKTPGLTCANELGMLAAQKTASRLNAPANQHFDPNRPKRIRPADMPFVEREIHIRNNVPSFGRIVCRCRGISEGEIVSSIHQFPGAVTLDGVKRRTGAGSGRCQGGFCAQRVIELLSRELGCTPDAVQKDGKGSYIFM